MRQPQDTISQRQLVYEMGYVIDGLMHGGLSNAIWEGRLLALLSQNPRSAFSTHVKHNIGARRLRFLDTYLATKGDWGEAMSVASQRHGKR